MGGGGILKKRIVRGGILGAILLLAYLHNLAVSYSSDYFLEKGEYLNARNMVQNTIPYVPNLYFSSAYFDRFSKIQAYVSIREYEYFHPPGTDGLIDVDYLEKTYGNLPFSKASELFKLYIRYIEAADSDDLETAGKVYNSIAGLLDLKTSHVPKMLEESLMYHADFSERIEDELNLFRNIPIYVDRYETSGRLEELYRILTLTRRFDLELEMRYPDEIPLFYLHGFLVRSIELFQGVVINAVRTGDGTEVIPYFKKSAGPVINAFLELYTVAFDSE